MIVVIIIRIRTKRFMQEGQTILFKNRVELPSIIYVSVPVEDAYYSTPEIQNWSHKHV